MKTISIIILFSITLFKPLLSIEMPIENAKWKSYIRDQKNVVLVFAESTGKQVKHHFIKFLKNESLLPDTEIKKICSMFSIFEEQPINKLAIAFI